MKEKYKTKQRAKILNYLIENKENHVTAEQIIEFFKDKNESIGKSTVYRYLDALVEEQVIRRYISSNEHSGACFQYIENNEKCAEHYHLKCVECGKLYHADLDALEQLKNDMLEKYHFKLDICRTVLYGLCDRCCNH